MSNIGRTYAFTERRWIAFGLAMILPSLVTIYGIVGLISHLCINRSFFLAFILFPLVIGGFFALCIFSDIRRYVKGILMTLLLLCYFLAYMNSVLFGTFVRLHHYQNEEVASHYMPIPIENKLMPSIEKVGRPIEIEYYDVFTKYFIFFARADYLICRYDSEEYALQKKRLDELYIFQTETMDVYDHPCEPSEEVDGYHFRVLSTKGDYEPFVEYPWYLTLIACCDEQQEIIYLSYGNTDIDYHTSLSSFLYEECGWSQVR